MRIFCSGIGGIGLSAYAGHMRSRGHEVFGSDKADSPILDDLRSQGVIISLKQDGSALPDDLDLFVYSEAIPQTSPERKKAEEENIPQKSYFQALGELTQGTDLICISGTHGKSSTTAMAAKVFMDLGKDPNVVVGTKMQELSERNWRKGNGDMWIVEACEYRKSFLHLQPKTVLITNADGDHFDSFKDIGEYQQAFVDFLRLMPQDGTVILHGSDPQAVSIAKRAGREFLDADTGEAPAPGVPGEHMKQNARLVTTLAKARGLEESAVHASLAGYHGTWRRMEVKGVTSMGVTVIDDYAHHPKEIQATIAAIKEQYPDRRLVCVFEPHTNDRTLKLWKDFLASFAEADLVLVTKVYDARPDKDREPADVAKFAAEIGRTSKVSCRPSGTMTKTKATLETLLQSDDVLLIMGAGDSTKLAEAMMP